MGLELLYSKMPCLIDITQSVFSMHFVLILHLWLPGNALFEMPMVVRLRLLHLDNEADRKSRFPKRWFPSTKIQQVAKWHCTDLVNLFPNKFIWARFDRLPMDSWMTLVIWLFARPRNWRFRNCPNFGVISPCRLFSLRLHKSKVWLVSQLESFQSGYSLTRILQ